MHVNFVLLEMQTPLYSGQNSWSLWCLL